MIKLNKSILSFVGLACSMTCSVAFVAPVWAQMSEAEKVASWIALDAPTGHEHISTKSLLNSRSPWRVDRHGNMIKTYGAGFPHKVVACALDAASFAVTQITEKGYLRLHTIGRGSRHPLWAQSHEGQQVRVLTRNGPVVGVTAASNGHFVNLHRDETTPVRPDDLWIDVGATSAGEVAEMGISLMDPIVRHVPAWTYGNEIAGPSAGARVGCANIVSLSELPKGKGRITWILSSQSAFGWVGLSSAIADFGAESDLGTIDELYVLGKGTNEAKNEIITSFSRRMDPVLKYAGVKKIQRLAPKVTNPGALMERITMDEVNDYRNRIMKAVFGGAGKSTKEWIAAPVNLPILNADPKWAGKKLDGSGLDAVEKLLDSLAEISATPGHEGPVRAKILAAMPKWARDIAQTDDMGNVWVEFGPKGGDATVFMAHMDEVGYEVQSIDKDGTVHLKRMGGAIHSAWEGQPALLQLDAGVGANSASSVKNLKGVFNTRDNAKTKTPKAITAWFGMDAEGLKGAGVKVGMGVTGYKEGHRLGKYRYTARGLDDRVGSTALLLGLHKITANHEPLKHRVIFAWSVQEEGGLNGAQVLANRFGAETKRIYSVDTFVSSDTPLESPHFAYAPLGSGPVLRSIESSGMVRPDELDRNKKIAGPDVQIGLTQGGTDGTTFTFWGVPNAGLSWPGRYSHGPAEVADLRDIEGLINLIEGFAITDPNYK